MDSPTTGTVSLIPRQRIPGSFKKELRKAMKHRYLYLLLIPGILYFIVFKYVPMYGIIIAFKDFKFSTGILGSDWVGLKHFQSIFASKDFWAVFRNTLILNFYVLLWGMPFPIILALLLNEIYHSVYKRVVQTMVYLPHFINWVILGGIIIQILSPSTGIVNSIIKQLSMEPVYFLASTRWWRSIYVISDIYKNIGWNSIIFLAAISSIDVEMYEASIIDGAGKLKRMWYITLPSIRPTIIILLILAIGKVTSIGFEHVFMLYNTSVYEVADVISTYLYRIGIGNFQYSFATAVGLFQSVISLVLIVSADRLSKKSGERGIF